MRKHEQLTLASMRPVFQICSLPTIGVHQLDRKLVVVKIGGLEYHTKTAFVQFVQPFDGQLFANSRFVLFGEKENKRLV